MLAGYSKSNDGAPHPQRGQMSHAWMSLCSFRRRDKQNLRILANFLCECCGFEQSHPQVFTEASLELRAGGTAAVGGGVQSVFPMPAVGGYIYSKFQSRNTGSTDSAPQERDHRSCQTTGGIESDTPLLATHASGQQSIP